MADCPTTEVARTTKPGADLVVGTPVLAWPGAREDSPLVTRTRTTVWSIYPDRPVVSVEGWPGGIALTHIEVLPPERMLTPWYVLRRVAQTMPHNPKAVEWLHIQADGWEASGMIATPVETDLRGDNTPQQAEHRPNGCCDYHRHIADGCCHCERGNPPAAAKEADRG